MANDVLLQHLDYLLALATERHFGRAAARCHVSQPTLSVAIRRLERELGIVIVQRGHRFEGFTEEGRRVVAWAQRIVAERDDMLADIDRMRGRLTVTARLGAIPTAVPASPFVTAEFLQRNPAASVRIEALSSREIARRLADFEIDGGLTYLDDEAPPGTKLVEMYREQYVLVAPADHPLMGESKVAWSDAATLELCVLTPTMRNRRILDANMAAEGVNFRPAVEADSVDALYAHVANSQRATIASTAWLPQLGVPPGFVARPMVQHGPRPAIGLVVLDRAPASIVAAALVEVAADIDLGARIDGVWAQMSGRAGR
ncbi:LysR family transcriptional regulator [Mycolicibacterium wolinskyi]|uniref:Probable hydrogen peroxide-inducible genes activator n=1 Tax=Mycolicibacterium wolinskyi TaxID=59750 RepID=A0A1X2EU06_9MYCO|nr:MULTISPECIES: LysR family transcriptional regulator [Mycolicibacterium]MCV7286945.1 LysR family transcriptional regulator [Mycolicibacterium wolinskyi]MCV7292438.1 LysR family transcriptional regulator [Mycolicibacterium goodii]ORX09667.1 LysR family transcriptional regulator [Mycolicibacterium wolinskyi]